MRSKPADQPRRSVPPSNRFRSPERNEPRADYSARLARLPLAIDFARRRVYAVVPFIDLALRIACETCLDFCFGWSGWPCLIFVSWDHLGRKGKFMGRVENSVGAFGEFGRETGMIVNEVLHSPTCYPQLFKVSSFIFMICSYTPGPSKSQSLPARGAGAAGDAWG
jgi:hypothetical protein